MFCHFDKNGYSGIPVKHLYSQFSQQSACGDTKTAHLREGNGQIFAHAWNAPEQKDRKPLKKAAKVWISDAYSDSRVKLWEMVQTYLLPAGIVWQSMI